MPITCVIVTKRPQRLTNDSEAGQKWIRSTDTKSDSNKKQRQKTTTKK